MKRIWFGAGLLIVLLLLGFGSSTFMERSHAAMAKDLSRAAELALEGNWVGAENFTTAAQREWDDNRTLIAALSDHEIMDETDGHFAQLEVFIRERDAISYSSTCLYLACQLDALGKSHSFNLQNFF